MESCIFVVSTMPLQQTKTLIVIPYLYILITICEGFRRSQANKVQHLLEIHNIQSFENILKDEDKDSFTQLHAFA